MRLKNSCTIERNPEMETKSDTEVILFGRRNERQVENLWKLFSEDGYEVNFVSTGTNTPVVKYQNYLTVGYGSIVTWFFDYKDRKKALV